MPLFFCFTWCVPWFVLMGTSVALLVTHTNSVPAIGMLCVSVLQLTDVFFADESVEARQFYGALIDVVALNVMIFRAQEWTSFMVANLVWHGMSFWCCVALRLRINYQNARVPHPLVSVPHTDVLKPDESPLPTSTTTLACRPTSKSPLLWTDVQYERPCRSPISTDEVHHAPFLDTCLLSNACLMQLWWAPPSML